MEIYDVLGFSWDRKILPKFVPIYSVKRVCFRFYRMLPEFVWDASFLEGNPFTFIEVKTLLDGVTVGGRRVSDHEQIINLADSSKYLLYLIKERKFVLNKEVFCQLHNIVARNEALEWGMFRGEGEETSCTPEVLLGSYGKYCPKVTQPGAIILKEIFSNGVGAILNQLQNAFEQALVFFMFGALQQFYFDGNKRTSRFMMNGVLMSAGIDAISIPAARAQEFNEKMVQFYLSKNADDMLKFLISCHPETDKIIY